jgi:hypothetical protein
MITIKKINKFESDIRRYKQENPIKFWAYITSILFLLLVLTHSIAIMLFNSSGVGTFIIGDFYSGLITYGTLYGVRIYLNINQLFSFVIISILTIFLYIKIKDLLMYRNENL